MDKSQDAAYYDSMKRGVELPDDPKPRNLTALKARKRAMREGRLLAPASSTLARAQAAEAAEMAVVEAAQGEVEAIEAIPGGAVIVEESTPTDEEIAAAELEG